MARPWKHPQSGIYWFRKRVPGDLRPLLGRSEEKQSLHTRDPAEAKRLHAAMLLKVEERWANARKRAREINWTEAQTIAGEVYRWQLDRFAGDPFRQREWDLRIGTTLVAEAAMPAESHLNLGTIDPDLTRRLRMQEWCEQAADRLLAERGLSVADESRCRLMKAVALAMQKASTELKKAESGVFVTTASSVKRENGLVFIQPSASEKPAVSFDTLIDGWAAEKKPGERTLYSWRRVATQLAKFLGNSDAAMVTADDLLRWKGHLIASGLGPKTIKDGKLAPMRAVLQWGVDNRRLDRNPAERITMGVKAKAGGGRRGFTDDEARIVLRASWARSEPHYRWVPWLCAYSGARVSEVCQLQKHDIHQHDGVWMMKFSAESGPLKNANSERAVPLHPALIESGFLQFVETVKNGPLFADLTPDRFGRRGGNGTKVLSRFVRELGLKDQRLAPIHSFRHRWKTQARRYGLELDIANAITGHGRRTVADAYGEFPAEAMLREMEKMPALKLD